MTMIKPAALSLCFFILQGCTEPEDNYKTHAQLANAGSLDGPYGIIDVYATDTSGGRMGFGFGAVNGFPGASADVGGLGVPNFIAGHWVKEDPETNRDSTFYRISSPIDSDLAKKKIETLENYYQNYSSPWGKMQFAVEGPRAMLFFTLSCGGFNDDCTPRQDADPNNWVVKDPRGRGDVVVLFDGLGESSPYPYPKSRLDTRTLGYNPQENITMDTVEVLDLDGTVVIPTESIEMPKSFKVAWKETLNPESDWKNWKYRYFQIEGVLEDPESQEEKIRAYRSKAFDGYLKSSDILAIKDGLDFEFVYRVHCWMPSAPCQISEDPEKRWEYIPEIEDYGVVLYRGKAQQSDTPFDGNK
ncbi:hypothetical protein G5S52_08430 [Grimontia sp. S25]|uniref:Lipoprotein n=1 Tax=Grimontia sedimenti TaxID=2711294 RepID=A0A6M1R5T6_9GAMM|nr:hypothetical protein [Grimontia sedimenti]NGN97695.1 hypothetical protein [Grimontia sedimenti]